MAEEQRAALVETIAGLALEYALMALTIGQLGPEFEGLLADAVLEALRRPPAPSAN